MKDYYKLLEVNETASPEVIQAAYKILAKKYHPDIAKPNEKAMKEAKMKEINNAKEILLNPVERQKYDIMLKQEKERLHNQVIESKVERHKEKERKKTASKSKRRYKNNDTVQSTVGGAFSGFFGLFKNFKENQTLIMICGFLFLLAFLQVFLCLGYFGGFFDGIIKSPSNSTDIIYPNETTKQEVIEMLGAPKLTTNNYLEYKEHSKILISGDIVTGWIDTYDELPILKYDKLPQIEDISVGMKKNDIIEKWGYPDTYSEKIIVYYNLIIRFENDIVTEVTKQG